MTIKYKSFTLTTGNGMYTWDLTQTVPVTARNEKQAQANGVAVGQATGTKDVVIGYDYLFEHACRRMLDILVAEKEDTVDLAGFFSAYRKEKDELTATLSAHLNV